MSFTKISSTRLKSEANRINVSLNQSSVDIAALQQQAIQFAKEFAPTQEELGKLNAGFQSITESVKPALETYAKRAEEVIKTMKKDPAISEMMSSVPNITVDKAPATKSNVDTLVGKSTASSKKLNKVISAGNPDAIKKSLEEALAATPDLVAKAVREAQDVANDPVVQKKFEDLGLPADVLTSLTSQMANGLDKFVEKNPSEETTTLLTSVAERTSKAIGNPIGSTSSPFGAVGFDFGNILGSLTGLSTGTGSFKELGKELETISGSIDPITGEEVPILIDRFGNTNISKVVDKGIKTAVSEPTTPVYTIGDADVPQSLANFTYEPVNDKKEFELEIKRTARELDHVIVSWTLSRSDEFWTAKEYNEKAITSRSSVSTYSTFHWNAAQIHYYIQKDGLVIRILPMELKPLGFTSIFGAKQKLYDKSVRIAFDAGYIYPIGPADVGKFSEKSITSEQWKSFDMMMDVLNRSIPGAMFIGQDELHADQGELFDTLGPGFDVPTYLNKKRENIDVQ
jgi:hypothetical protein